VIQRLAAARARTVRLAREDAGFSSRRRRRACSAGSTCGVDTDRLAQRLLHDEGWLLAPGSLFHARRSRRR
jgi:hypothetical protein